MESLLACCARHGRSRARLSGRVRFFSGSPGFAIGAGRRGPLGNLSSGVQLRTAAAVAGAGSGGGAPLPEHLQKIVDEYDRRRAEEAASKGGLLHPRLAGVFGILFATALGIVVSSFDDVSSEVTHLLARSLRRLDRERLHRLLLWAAERRLLPKDYDKDDPYLMIEPQEGLKFMNPVGLASGFDVDAQGPSAFLDMGFGFVEVGPVGAVATTGAVGGVTETASRLAARDRASQICSLGLVGAVLYAESGSQLYDAVQLLGPHVDYVAVDLTETVCQGADPSALIERAVRAAADLPSRPRVFARLPAVLPTATRAAPAAGNAASAAAPVATATLLVGDLAAVAFKAGADGLILFAQGGGDASPDSRAALTEAVAEAYRSTGGRLVLVANGGISTALHALDYIQAGASAVQISTLLLSEGPQACRRLKDELSLLLMNEGFVNLQEAVGSAHRRRKRGRRTKNPWQVKPET